MSFGLIQLTHNMCVAWVKGIEILGQVLLSRRFYISTLKFKSNLAHLSVTEENVSVLNVLAGCTEKNNDIRLYCCYVSVSVSLAS